MPGPENAQLQREVVKLASPMKSKGPVVILARLQSSFLTRTFLSRFKVHADLSDWSEAWLSAARTVAAAAVVLGHARGLVLTDYDRNASVLVMPLYFFSSLGHEAVVVFFVLSGFWITRSILCGVESKTWSWPKYLIDRVSRLSTVLIPALVVGGLLDYVGIRLLGLNIYSGNTGGNVIADDVAHSLTLTTFLLNMLFLQNGIVECFGSNKALWSLSNEFWYYIVFPLAYWANRSLASVCLLVLVGAFIVAYLPAIIPGLAIWLIGSGVAVFPSLRLFGMRYSLAVALTSLIALMAISKLLGVFGVWSDVAVALSFSACLLAVVARKNGSPRPLLRLMAIFGQNSSYSLYAIHLPILVITVGILLPAGRRIPEFPNLLLVAGLCGLAIVAGWVFSACTERHTAAVRRTLKRFVQSRRAASS